jgi:hypothetical protein
MMSALAVKRSAPHGAAFRARFFRQKRMHDVGAANNWQNFQSKRSHDTARPAEAVAESDRAP